MTESREQKYSPEMLELAGDEDLCGRMNDPTAAAFVKGICGDEMEFYLVVHNGTITEAKYWTDGCEVTRACGAWVARNATGKSVIEALELCPASMLKRFPEIPDGHRHCPILATCTFFQAIGDYLLKP